MVVETLVPLRYPLLLHKFPSKRNYFNTLKFIFSLICVLKNRPKLQFEAISEKKETIIFMCMYMKVSKFVSDNLVDINELKAFK